MAVDDAKEWLTPAEVARLCGVSPITVRLWANQGKLKSTTTAGGHRRFLNQDVAAFMDQSDRADDQPFRILIVDDEPDVAELLQDLLQVWSKNHDVTLQVDWVDNGFAAGMQTLQLKPDLVMLDIKMPGLQGDEVCRLIKKNPGTAATPVIGMTGYLTPENHQAMLASGAAVVLAKPFNTTELYGWLDELVTVKEHC